MADASDGKRDFFISFNQADRAWATWIAWVLEEAGYSVFFQDWDFRGNFILEMDRAHQQSRRTLAVLSPDYLASRFTAPEWAARFAQDAMSQHDLLILVRVREFELPGLLGPIVYVDLVGLAQDQARRRLLDRVAGIRVKPDEEPFYPGGPLPAAARSVPSEPRFSKAESDDLDGPFAPRSLTPPLRLFISYAHRDEKWRKELEIYLKPLVRRGTLEVWSDKEIDAGEEWWQIIHNNLENADIILLLISPSFMGSEFIYNEELKRAIARHEFGEARVIPVFLRSCDWKEEVFGKLQGVPDDAKPILRWQDRDKAFTIVVRAIRKAVKTLSEERVKRA